MNRRINIILPEQTLALLDRVTVQGNRLAFISQAVMHCVETRGKQNLRAQ